VELVDRSRLGILLDGVHALAAQGAERGMEAADAREEINEGERRIVRAHVRTLALSLWGKQEERACCGEGVRRPPQASRSLSAFSQLQTLVLSHASQTR